MTRGDYAELVFAVDLLATLAFVYLATFALMRVRRGVRLYVCAALACAAFTCVVYPALPAHPRAWLYQPAPPVDYGDH